jgi:hypothetical protein
MATWNRAFMKHTSANNSIANAQSVRFGCAQLGLCHDVARSLETGVMS